MPITLAALLAKMRAAQPVRGCKNVHRVVFGQCEEVLMQLIQAIEMRQQVDVVDVSSDGQKRP